MPVMSAFLATGGRCYPRHWPPPGLVSSPMKRALITGISGQDGSYLAELLLDRGYEVWGMVRRSPGERFENLEHLRERINLVQGDMLDQMTLLDAVSQARP